MGAVTFGAQMNTDTAHVLFSRFVEYLRHLRPICAICVRSAVVLPFRGPHHQGYEIPPDFRRNAVDARVRNLERASADTVIHSRRHH